MNATTEINVQDPWFSAIARGSKTVEGRLHKGKFAEMQTGTVLNVNKSGGKKRVLAVVIKVVKYPTFEEYLSCEGLNSTLPGIKSIADGVAVYRKFYSVADERRYGIAAVHLALLK